MKRRRTSFLRSGEGNVMIEFAFVAPMLFLLIFGLIESGRLYFGRSSVLYALEEAGRYAMLHTSANSTAISEQITQHLIGVDPADVTITVTTQTVNGQPFKQITAVYNFTTVVGGLLNWGTIPLTLQTSVPAISLVSN